MPLLADKNSIIETIGSHPEQIRKLWIEQGFERVFEDLIREARSAGVQFRVIARDDFAKRFKGIKSHICLERDEFSFADPDTLLDGLMVENNPFLCAFDGVQDPQNLGNIIRSAVCLDTGPLIIPKDRACTITDTVTQIARGAVEHVTITRVTNLSRYLDSLKKKGVFCYALDERGDKPLWEIDLTGPVCLVFGGEEGMRRLTRETCDEVVNIPTSVVFPSLNVATCFALTAYEVGRQRKRAK